MKVKVISDIEVIIFLSNLGSQPATPNYRQEDAHTEERIAQILNDAQAQMQIKNNQEKVNIH